MNEGNWITLPTIIKAYLAIHKTTGKPWKGKKVIFDCIVGLTAALDASWSKSHGKGRSWQEVYSVVAYELRDGTILKE